MPFATAMPTIAAGGRPGTGACMKHVPDKRCAIARVLTLDRNAESFAPPCHRTFRARGRNRVNDSFNNFLTAMGRTQRNRRAGLRPHDRALFSLNGQWPDRTRVLSDVGVEQKSVGHHDSGLSVSEGRVNKTFKT